MAASGDYTQKLRQCLLATRNVLTTAQGKSPELVDCFARYRLCRQNLEKERDALITHQTKVIYDLGAVLKAQPKPPGAEDFVVGAIVGFVAISAIKAFASR